MNEIDNITKSKTVAKLPLLAAVVALIGLSDAVYLTVHHLTAELVPCSVTGGCETVLTSEYAEIAGIPLAGYGAVAYFIAFVLATLAAFGKRTAWKLFGVQVMLMALASAYFVYLQIFVIKAICQYCMLSAAVCFTLFIIALISKFWKK
jgi:uncharacterized membrane protein